MLEPGENKELPEIPAKKYFTIGEVAGICDLKPHVLRYWEQEFSQLKPVTRRGNRRYYQQHDVLLIRKIRNLLYQEGFTISGAIQQLNAETNGEQSSTEAENSVKLKELKIIRHKLEEIITIIEA